MALRSAAASLGVAGRSLVMIATRASGTSRPDLLGQTLDAGAAGDQGIDRAAFRAMLGLGPAVAAVMTEQAAAQAVVDQPGAAVRAAQPMAAGPAQGERRKAAPIEEQERLLAGGKRLGQRRAQGRGEPGAARRPVLAQIEQADLRHRRAAVARRQQQGGRRRLGPGWPLIRPADQAVSSAGVAETSTAGHCSRRARAIAMSRPW